MKSLLLTLIICITSFAASAQYNQKRSGGPKPSNSAADLPFSERIFFGGGGSFSAGVHPYYGYKYTFFSVSPLVGYRLTMPWAAGVQLTYQTYRFPTQNFHIDQYGFAPFTQYRFGKVFAYAEYQLISVPNTDNTIRRLYKRLPIGIGFTQPIGTRAAINAVALYDVLYNRATSPFASPWVFRIYITAGGIAL